MPRRVRRLRDRPRRATRPGGDRAAGFLARGGLLLFVLPVVVLPTTVGISNWIGADVVDGVGPDRVAGLAARRCRDRAIVAFLAGVADRRGGRSAPRSARRAVGSRGGTAPVRPRGAGDRPAPRRDPPGRPRAVRGWPSSGPANRVAAAAYHELILPDELVTPLVAARRRSSRATRWPSWSARVAGVRGARRPRGPALAAARRSVVGRPRAPVADLVAAPDHDARHRRRRPGRDRRRGCAAACCSPGWSGAGSARRARIGDPVPLTSRPWPSWRSGWRLGRRRVGRALAQPHWSLEVLRRRRDAATRRRRSCRRDRAPAGAGARWSPWVDGRPSEAPRRGSSTPAEPRPGRKHAPARLRASTRAERRPGRTTGGRQRADAERNPGDSRRDQRLLRQPGRPVRAPRDRPVRRRPVVRGGLLGIPRHAAADRQPDPSVPRGRPDHPLHRRSSFRSRSSRTGSSGRRRRSARSTSGRWPRRRSWPRSRRSRAVRPAPVASNDEWIICPTCRTRLNRVCPNCSRLVGLDWSLCAWCGRDFERPLAALEPVYEPREVGAVRAPRGGAAIGPVRRGAVHGSRAAGPRGGRTSRQRTGDPGPSRL